ncbi:MAG TPA: DUF1971 domain-containing protein [Deltaproteobacteria bacterium]|nr:DUF1971 domain-containing protein [Deltaproteobacteria bacterium]
MLEPYRRTDVFTEDTVPAGLLRDHRTRAGVWGRIVVESGCLVLTTAGGEQVRLGAGDVHLVRPQERHAVTPVGAVAFYVEFCREVEPPP